MDTSPCRSWRGKAARGWYPRRGMDNRHYCPVPVATWIHSGHDAPEGPSSEAKLLLYHFAGTNVTDDRSKTAK